jgi:hypothetical protein
MICSTLQPQFALATGVSPKVLSEQLGHASIAFRFDNAHVFPHTQDEAVARNDCAWRFHIIHKDAELEMYTDLVEGFNFLLRLLPLESWEPVESRVRP